MVFGRSHITIGESDLTSIGQGTEFRVCPSHLSERTEMNAQSPVKVFLSILASSHSVLRISGTCRRRTWSFESLVTFAAFSKLLESHLHILSKDYDLCLW